MPGRNESCSSQKPSLRDPSWLRGAWAPQGRVPGKVRCGKRNQIIGLEEDNNLEELTYINDLTASLLCSLGGPHIFSLGVNLCLASVSTKETVSLCAGPLVIVLFL